MNWVVILASLIPCFFMVDWGVIMTSSQPYSWIVWDIILTSSIPLFNHDGCRCHRDVIIALFTDEWIIVALSWRHHSLCVHTDRLKCYHGVIHSLIYSLQLGESWCYHDVIITFVYSCMVWEIIITSSTPLFTHGGFICYHDATIAFVYLWVDESVHMTSS